MARPPKPSAPVTLTVTLDAESEGVLGEAARLRGVTVSDYVREVVLPQARREVKAAQEHSIVMTPEEQLAFWTALSAKPKLSEAQKGLGRLMRGEE